MQFINGGKRFEAVRSRMVVLSAVAAVSLLAGCASASPTEEAPSVTVAPELHPRSASAPCGALGANEALWPGEGIVSCDGLTQLVHQTDGNVVLYRNGAALWHTHTDGLSTTALIMQGDGNLVLYGTRGIAATPGWTALWSSQTFGHPGAALSLQGDCNAVVYEGATPLWNSQTDGCRYAPAGAFVAAPR